MGNDNENSTTHFRNITTHTHTTPCIDKYHNTISYKKDQELTARKKHTQRYMTPRFSNVDERVYLSKQKAPVNGTDLTAKTQTQFDSHL
jgi:hypothetical protein